MKVYNLPHDTYCKALGRCACTRFQGKRVCSSLTIPAGGFQKELPEAVLYVAEVLRDVGTGVLRANRISNKEKKTTPTRKSKSGSGRKRKR